MKDAPVPLQTSINTCHVVRPNNLVFPQQVCYVINISLLFNVLTECIICLLVSIKIVEKDKSLFLQVFGVCVYLSKMLSLIINRTSIFILLAFIVCL